MTDPTEACRLLACHAGLDLALAAHPADVQAAFDAALRAEAGLPAPATRTAEPWPPMRVAHPA